MILITASEFRKNQKKYFQMALKEKIGVKSGNTIFEIIPSEEVYVNPSPSGDPFWDDPRQWAEVERSIVEIDADIESGKYLTYPTLDEVLKRAGV